jgi:MFS transporter, putative metabolite:H+ symporter
MKVKIPPKYLTLLTAGLAYLSNVFTVNLPYVLKEKPLLEFGFKQSELIDANAQILAFQHLGILIGAIVFGIMADKKGRLFLLFTSVFIYSIGTLAGGLAQNYYLFVFFRFIVGLGLAAELGIGLVLVSEIFPQEKRSLAILFIAIMGYFGMFLVGILASHFYWRNLYLCGGLGSFLIMILRFGTFESDIFLAIKKDDKDKVSIINLIKEKKFLYLILSILPTYLITAGSIFAGSYLIKNGNLDFKTGIMILYFSLGAILGFIAFVFMSKFFKSRKKTIQLCILTLMVLSAIFSFNKSYTTTTLLILFILLGLFSAYLFELLTITMEQFGTNYRALATTLVFGIGRSSVFVFSIIIPIFDKAFFNNYLYTLFAINLIVFSIAIWAINQIKEEYNRDLQFLE